MKALIALLFTLTSLSSSAESRSTIKIVAPSFWCPYACEAESQQQGFAIDLTRAAFNEVNIQVDYQNRPYDRALFEVRAGKADAVIPTFKEEAPDFLYPKQAVSQTKYCFYTIEDSWTYTGIDSIKDTKIGATSGYTYSPDMDAFIRSKENIQVYLLLGNNISSRLYSMLSSNRIQAILEDSKLMEHYANTHETSEYLHSAGCLNKINSGYLALSPSDSKRSLFFSKKFDEGLNSIKLKGIDIEILNQYGLSK